MQNRTKIEDVELPHSMASIDPIFARGMKLMLSDEPAAAHQLRAMLDEALMNKYGVRLKLPGETSVEEPKKLSSEGKNLSTNNSPAQSSSEESNEPVAAIFDDSFSMHLTDLSCVICGQLNVGVRNQLMECNGCQHLYHQDCHTPPVKELANANDTWICAHCISKTQVAIESEGAVGGAVSSAFTTLCNVLEDFYPEQNLSSTCSANQSTFASESTSDPKNKRHSSSHESVIHYKSSSSSTSTSIRHSR